MKIYWWSNSPHVHTGYGNQTALITPRINQIEQHEVILGSLYGVQGSPLTWQGMQVLPQPPYGDITGNSILAGDQQYLGADIVITLFDSFTFDRTEMSKFRWIPYMPIDHDPVPPLVAKALSVSWVQIAYSKWGKQKLEDLGFNPLYIPHGVDTDVYKPMDRAEAREFLGVPEDSFVAGIVAANKDRPSRKCFDQQIRAFANLRKKHPDALLYIHTAFESIRGDNIAELIDLAGIPRKAILQPDQHMYKRGLLNSEYLNTVYNALDVLLNASRGEGFGIPIIEAQAAGTPVIASGFSAMPELVKAGWIVEVDEDDAYFSQSSYQYIPKVSGITDKLELAYNLSDEGRAALAETARDSMLKEYDIDVVFVLKWIPALAEISQKLEQETQRREDRFSIPASLNGKERAEEAKEIQI